MSQFDELYEEYKKELEAITGGLVEPNKADFAKQLAFGALQEKEINKQLNKITIEKSRWGGL